MPTYEYACSACGHAFDAVQSMSDSSLTVCPQCGQESLRKVFNNVGVVFKGSGFYRTDSRDSKSSPSTSGSSTSAPASSATSSAADSSSSSSAASTASSTTTSTSSNSGTSASTS